MYVHADTYKCPHAPTHSERVPEIDSNACILIYVCICICMYTCMYVNTLLCILKQVDRKNPPPPAGFPIYYVPSSRTVCKRTPLEEPGTNPSRGVLLHTVLDEGT